MWGYRVIDDAQGLAEAERGSGYPPPRATVLLTDHPWEDLSLEESIFEEAGLAFVAGPSVALAQAEIDQLVSDCSPIAILTCWAVVSGRAIATPGLRIVARLGVGLDNIDVEAATAAGVSVTNVPDYCVGEVSDHAIALLLAHFRGIARLDRAVKRTGWPPNGEHLERISDLTIAIIGYGRIGRETGRKLQAFGCRILAASRPNAPADGIAQFVDIASIQAEADVIILHAPLVEETRNIVNRTFLEGCKRAPLLINLSRGGLVDNDALLGALDTGQLRGAALDVVEGEPSPPPALLAREDVIATPHIAFASRASMLELRRRGCEEVVRALRGQPLAHLCNNPALGRPLDGGVASDVRIVDTTEGP
jgi:phosphoglycerate dehydrogenase-like enzyme